jgi:plasmid stabilization system protein ParE
MPQGDKSSYTDKQKRRAEHIEESYEKRGTPKKVAEARAWATVNKETGGGKLSGSGRGKPENRSASSRGGRAHKSGSAEQRSAAARKGWETRRRNASA